MTATMNLMEEVIVQYENRKEPEIPERFSTYEDAVKSVCEVWFHDIVDCRSMLLMSGLKRDRWVKHRTDPYPYQSVEDEIRSHWKKMVQDRRQTFELTEKLIGRMERSDNPSDLDRDHKKFQCLMGLAQSGWWWIRCRGTNTCGYGSFDMKLNKEWTSDFLDRESTVRWKRSPIIDWKVGSVIYQFGKVNKDLMEYTESNPSLIVDFHRRNIAKL